MQGMLVLLRTYSCCLFLLPRPITRLKYQQNPKGKVQNVSAEGCSVTPRQLPISVCQFVSTENWGMCVEMGLKGVESRWENIKVDQAEFVDIGPLSRATGLSVGAGGAQSGSDRLLGCLICGPTGGLCEAEMSLVCYRAESTHCSCKRPGGKCVGFRRPVSAAAVQLSHCSRQAAKDRL